MEQNGVDLAPAKSEAVPFIGRKKCPSISLKLAGQEIKIVESARYLGVHLDRAMTGSAHIEIAAAKASKAAAGLSRIMPNIYGPREVKRRMIMRVAESIIRFGAPIWVS